MTKKSVARRHHFIPQAYLAQFTDAGTKEGKFFVLEVKSSHCFHTSPTNVAVERDFNRIDIEGYQPDVIENSLASLEDDAVRAIRDTAASGEFPSDKNYSAILHLICLLAVRNPFLRQSFNRARSHADRIFRSALMGISKNHAQETKKNGLDIADTLTLQEMGSYVKNEKNDSKFQPQMNLQLEMNTFQKVLPILHKRTWSLIIAPADCPEFICSDHPVTLAFKSGRRGPIGVGLEETELFFPLTRRIGFYGTFEDSLKKVVHARPTNVAKMNQRLALNARRHIYTALDSFVIWHENEIQTIDCSIKLVKRI
jgi:Protein of unknown function (DUF4238)